MKDMFVLKVNIVGTLWTIFLIIGSSGTVCFSAFDSIVTVLILLSSSIMNYSID